MRRRTKGSFFERLGSSLLFGLAVVLVMDAILDPYEFRRQLQSLLTPEGLLDLATTALAAAGISLGIAAGLFALAAALAGFLYLGERVERPLEAPLRALYGRVDTLLAPVAYRAGRLLGRLTR
jgi:hypothetical protein